MHLLYLCERKKEKEKKKEMPQFLFNLCALGKPGAIIKNTSHVAQVGCIILGSLVKTRRKSCAPPSLRVAVAMTTAQMEAEMQLKQ